MRRTLKTVLILSCLAAFAGAEPAPTLSTEAREAVTRLEAAEVTYDRAQLQLAIDTFSRLHAQEPKNPWYPYFLARSQFPLVNIHDYQNDKTRAEEAGQKGIELLEAAVAIDDKVNPDAYRLLGDFYGRLSLFQGVFGRMRYGSRSMTYHRKALEMAPSSFLAMVGSATDKLYAPGAFGGDVDGAVEMFRKAIALEPKSPVGYVWLAKAYIKQKKFEDARAQFAKALEVRPDSAFARGELKAESEKEPRLAQPRTADKS